jgi:hypothetical protein
MFPCRSLGRGGGFEGSPFLSNRGLIHFSFLPGSAVKNIINYQAMQRPLFESVQ